MTVVLLYGGKSEEHDVSLRSAAAILPVLVQDFTVQLIAADKETGAWYLQDSKYQQDRAQRGEYLTVQRNAKQQVLAAPGAGLLCKNGKAIHADCVFPIIHGATGEDGNIQGLLTTAGIPFVGSSTEASAVCMNKLRTKQLWQQAALPVVPYFTVTVKKEQEQEHIQKTARTVLQQIEQQIEETFGFPVFVKPAVGGSSIGITHAAHKQDLERAIQCSAALHTTVLIEQAIPAREIETAVLGNEHVQVFPPGEVVVHKKFYDYDAKYEDSSAAELLVPAPLKHHIADTIQNLAVAAYNTVGASGMARVDCFIHRKTEHIMLNEINTIPGFTASSLYPKMAEHGGIPYRSLLRQLIELALQQ